MAGTASLSKQLSLAVQIRRPLSSMIWMSYVANVWPACT
jgi:hypothetical protein